MSVSVKNLELPGLKLVELTVHGDDRGFFVERYNEEQFSKNGLPTNFAQDNHSRSAPGVLRGLHYQFEPAQGKLVGVTKGKIWDVAVDIRKGSPTYGKSYGVELTDTNGLMLWVPPGFAHGFYVSSDQVTDVIYKVTSIYNPKGEQGILWNDPDLSVEWPSGSPTLSKRDQQGISFKEYDQNPVFNS